MDKLISVNVDFNNLKHKLKNKDEEEIHKIKE